MKNSLKKILAFALAFVMVFGSAPLEAITGIDFGNIFGIEAEAASFTPRYSSPATSGWYSWYTRNNCTTYVSCRANEILGYKAFPKNYSPSVYYGYGNFEVGQYPKPGSIGVASGHVFIVESVNGSTMTISEGHYTYRAATGGSYFNVDLGGASTGTRFCNRTITFNTKTGRPNKNVIGTWYGYVYLLDGETASPSPTPTPTPTPTIFNVDERYQATCNNIRVRTGPSTSYAIKYKNNKNDYVEIDQISGDWGRIKGTTYWTCLTYYNRVETIQKPTAPQISATVTGDVPVGTNSIISWPAVSNATGYKVYLNGTEVQNSSATNYTVKAFDKKTYTVHVVAYNNSYSSEKSNSVSITAHNPSTVTFLDWDGSTISTQTVDYGKNAVSSEAPSREGYTFTGWDKSLEKVTSDLTVKATYKIKTFTIKFTDSKGDIIPSSTQKVNYGDSATPPTVPLETGHVFVGWSSEDYKNVKKDAIIQAITQWGNDDLPIVAEITSASRQEDGYYVYFDLTNYPTATTSGRAVITLKTAEGKLVDTTESAAFSIPKNGTKTGMEVFIPCDRAATTIELVIVKDYSTFVPISANVSSTIDEGDSWSDWSTTAPEDTSVELETKTQYRFREKTYKTTTSKLSTFLGMNKDWILESTTSTLGDWSDWSDTAVTASSTREVQTRQQSYAITETKYKYYHWKHVDRDDWLKYQPGWKYEYHTITLNYSLGYSWTGDSGDWCGSYACPACDESTSSYKSNCWCLESSWVETVGTGTKTQYRYRDTTNTYTYYKLGDWSEWQDSPITATSTNEVETQTLYRYRGAGAGVENTSGETRTISGTLDPSFAGKQITLFVYKVDEASDYSNEHVAQSVIADDGSYSFTFKLREEPTVKTGDFTVAIGIEGTNNTIVIDTIEAPKATYTVTFTDWDGNIIAEKTVTEGESVELPENPTREGHTFVGWDSNLTNIKEDIEVNARYVINTYSVIFVDWIKQTINVQTYNHGDVITLPETENVYGYDFTGWEGIDGEYVATQNLILTASYDAKEYTVKFYDYDGNVLSNQTVNYGDSSEIPDDLTEDGRIFLGWDYNGNLLEVDRNVTAIPVYVFEETVETPVADVESGSYNSAQTVTLSCETENAVIYYTLDGSDPIGEAGIEYTAPITVDKTSQLRFVASALGKNDSSEVSKYYAINDGNMTSEWLAFDDIPQFVMDNLSTRYTLISGMGYRYKDVITLSSTSAVNNYLANGWTTVSTSYGEWTEWSKETPNVNDVEIEIEEDDAPAIPTQMYQYTRFKYTDASGSIAYSEKEIANVEGEWETLLNETILNISGFVSGTRTPIYSKDGEEWFNQSKVTVDVTPDYKMYRYRIKNYTISKWTEWTETEPSETETRETQSDVVYKYTGYKSHVVTLVSLFGEDNLSFFNIADEKIDLTNANCEIEGFTIVGYYTDKNYTTEWDIENDVVTGDMTLYVKYEIESYNVTFKNSDGTVLSTQTVEYGSSATPPEVPVDDGYAFVRWDTEDYIGVTSDLVVTAIVKPEDEIIKVSLNRYTFKMMEGSMTQIVATVTPDTIESTAVVWSSSDYSIADVDHNGFVTALSAGTVEIKATAIDGTYAVCEITIEEYIDSSLKLNSYSTYALDQEHGYLRGVAVSANTVDEIKSNFKNNDIVIIKDGEELTGDALVGTGAEIRLMDGDVIVDAVSIVVTGDATGDGYINNRDAAYLTRYVVSKEAPSMVQLVAMDVNGDGSVNNRDASMVARYLVGKETL